MYIVMHVTWCKTEIPFYCNIINTLYKYRALETPSNAASSAVSKKSKGKHLTEAKKQRAEAEAKAAKEREEVGGELVYSQTSDNGHLP